MDDPVLSPRVRLALLASALLMLSVTGNADDTEEIYALIEQNQLSDAMRQTKTLLDKAPGDPTLLFAQAVIAEKNGNPEDAVRIYQGLTLSHPELLEPFNNLAIHYARAGDYKAAISTLELAMQSHPAVATAYQNLTAIYAQLASAAYRKALDSDTPLEPLELASLEKIDPNALGAVRDQPRLVASVENYLNESLENTQNEGDNQSLPLAIENVTPEVEVVAPPAKTEPETQPSEIVVTEVETAVIEPAEPEKAIETAKEPKPEPAVIAAVTPTAEAKQAAEQYAAQKQALIDQVKSWASAWSDRDVDRYLAHYSGNFVPRDNLALDEWKKQRYGRLRWREFIIVKPSKYNISVDGNTASVEFDQYYKSERFEDTIRKTLRFRKETSGWLITRELI
ncbi:MAG: L,D-transpeptidase Cds6 family protein [bacterium]